METESGSPSFDRSKRHLLGRSKTFGVLANRIEPTSQGSWIDNLDSGKVS